jgi:hypothetical protein
MSDPPLLLEARCTVFLRRLARQVSSAAAIIEDLTGEKPCTAEEVVVLAAELLGERAEDLLALTPDELLQKLQALKRDAPDETAADPANARPKRGKNIDARMLKILAEDKDAFSWTARRWAERLGCSPSTVAETTTWKTHLHKIRAAAKVERAERSLRRRP